MCVCVCVSSFKSKLRSSGEQILSGAADTEGGDGGAELVRGVNPLEDRREDSFNGVRVRWRHAILMKREMRKRERELLDDMETPQTIKEFDFYIFSLSLFRIKF